ncbi:unnamed protein product [Caenorhabditis brenneri]
MSSTVKTDVVNGTDSTKKTTPKANAQLIETPHRPIDKKPSPSARADDSTVTLGGDNDQDKENRSCSRNGGKHRSNSSESNTSAKKQRTESSPNHSDDDKSDSSSDESNHQDEEQDVEDLYNELKEIRSAVNDLQRPMKDILKRGELKPLVEALEKHRKDVNQAVSTEKESLKRLISSLKDRVQALKDAHDNASEREQNWESALQKINDLGEDLSEVKASIGQFKDILAKVDGFFTGFQFSSASSQQPLEKKQAIKKPKEKKPTCIFCDSKVHKAKDCDSFGTYAARIARGKELSLCIKCCQKFTDDGSGVHSSCRASTISCSGCSKFLQDKALCNHNRAFCSVTPSEPPKSAPKQDNKKGTGAVPPLQGMFNAGNKIN